MFPHKTSHFNIYIYRLVRDIRDYMNHTSEMLSMYLLQVTVL